MINFNLVNIRFEVSVDESNQSVIALFRGENHFMNATFEVLLAELQRAIDKVTLEYIKDRPLYIDHLIRLKK
jgi:hypothetical protein